MVNGHHLANMPHGHGTVRVGLGCDKGRCPIREHFPFKKQMQDILSPCGYYAEGQMLGLVQGISCRSLGYHIDLQLKQRLIRYHILHIQAGPVLICKTYPWSLASTVAEKKSPTWLCCLTELCKSQHWLKSSTRICVCLVFNFIIRSFYLEDCS